MSTTPEPADATGTQAAQQPETSQVEDASATGDHADKENRTDAADRDESDAQSDAESDSGTDTDTDGDTDQASAAPVAAETASDTGTDRGTDRGTDTDPDTDGDTDPASAARVAAETASDSASDSEPDSEPDAEPDSKDEGDSDEERQRAAEEFAAEHDPANHDIAAGEEFRQPGDWTAEEGGPQVWDSEGNLISENDGNGDDSNGDGNDGDDDENDKSDANSGDSDSHSDGDGDGDRNSEVQGQPEGARTGDAGRRVSELEEVRDGGYSVGSAATIHDGAMPFGHPVKAWEDTKTFVTEEHEHYAEAEPHVWFTDAEAAQRAGFTPAD